LSPFELQTLRRISVFGGNFSLDAVRSVCDADVDHTQLSSTMTALVEKSLVIAKGAAGTKGYRLWETTRAYLQLKLAESGERPLIARRHAIYCTHLLKRTNGPEQPVSDELATLCAQHIHDVRAALQWSFSEEGDLNLGTTLATGSIPLFSRLSVSKPGKVLRSNA
jgi:predicted ATPase